LQLLLRLPGDVRDHGADPPQGDPSSPGGRPLPGPAIVWIEIGDFELLERGRD